MKIFNKKYIVCNSRNVIGPEYVGRLVVVYNGRQMQNFSVKPGMVGFKFGEFIRTKRLGSIIHQTGKRAKKNAAKRK